jgi:hypothetical protein
MYFFADADYDILTGKNDSVFVYNAYCNNHKKLHYNDMEAFLMNTPALGKVLANMDIDPSEADQIKIKMEKASRIPGKLRAADEIVRRRNNLRNSILNGFEIRAFFSPR